MICVECTNPVDKLWTCYSDETIRATTCQQCGHFADKYIEADAVVVALDLLLLEPTAIRHVVFNIMGEDDGGLMMRIVVMVTLFDVYLQWANAERSSTQAEIKLLDAPVFIQYLTFIAICSVETLGVHIVVRRLAQWLLKWSDPRTVSSAVIVGSASKLLPILTLNWDYDMPLVSALVRYVVGFCLVEVLKVVLDCGYTWSVLLTAAVLGLRWLVHESMWQFLSLAM